MNNAVFSEIQIEELSNFVTDIEDGKVNPLRAYAEIKKVESFLAQAKKQIEPLAFDEADKYPEKSFEAEGFKFEKRNGGLTYNYKGIPEWNRVDAKKKELEKQAQTAWKLYQQTGQKPITEEGEELPLPEIGYRKDSLVVKSATL